MIAHVCDRKISSWLCPGCQHDDIEERAAIAEHDGGLSRADAEALAAQRWQANKRRWFGGKR